MFGNTTAMSLPGKEARTVSLTRRRSAPIMVRPWEWEELPRTPSVTRGREGARIATILDRTSLNSVASSAPMAVARNPYYRFNNAPGSVHGLAEQRIAPLGLSATLQ